SRTENNDSRRLMDYRIEKDSMGEVRVPKSALYGAQTQRAVENFPISGYTFPRTFIRALGLIKAAAARVNLDLGLLDAKKAGAIERAALAVAEGEHDDQFPIDIFQTGSGTSTNMNANEVIATLASRAGQKVHPNDDVNMCQSSNDVIPTAVHVAAALEMKDNLLPALEHLRKTLRKRAEECDDVVKTGRTHLMDAMPVRLGQEIGGWAAQIELAMQPGSSIMPGKINPVIPEATMMVCVEVMGNDVTIALCNASGNFQLNVMLPLLADNLLESITLLGNVSRVLADKAVAGFAVNRD